MAKQLFKNNAASNISGTLTQGGTTITLATGTGDEFPTPSGGSYFLLTIFEKDESGVEERIEVVKVTARTADTLTVVRDFESMTGQSGGFAYPSAANKAIYAELRWTSAGADSMMQKGENLADLDDAATARTNLGISAANTPFTPTGTISATNVQGAIAELATEKEAQDATLDALAGLTTAADKIPYFTGVDTATVTDLTAYGRSLIAGASASAVRTTLGLGSAAVQADTYFAPSTRTLTAGTGLSGGGDLSANRTLALANTAVVASNYGSATQVGTFTVNAQGQLTAAANVTVTPAWTSITGKPTTISGYGITDAQPLDADLTAISGISATSGLLKKTAADSWTLDTNTYLTGNQSITVSGDATGSGTTAITLTLANSGVTAGTYNNSATANIPMTVDAKGRVTATGTAVTITPAWGSITSKPTTISGYGITDAQPLDADLTAIAALTGTAGFLKTSGAGVWSVDTNTYLTTATAASTYLTTATASTTYQPVSARNAANGYAGLDGSGLIPSTLLPSYVDDVLEYAALANFPATGETGKIYVALDTNKTYRWSGSAYVYITSGAVDSVAGKTGVVTLVKGDVGLGNVENTSLSTWAGTTNITTLGTVATGTWNATTISVAKGGTGATDAATARTNLGVAIGSNVQAWDADLDAIASLAGTSGFLKKTAANTWSLDTNTYLTGITSGQVTTALGYTPYNSTNPNGYTTNTGTVTSIGGTGTVSGLTLSGTVTTSGNLTLGGTLAVTPANFASQTANTVLAAPNGSAGVPTFRALAAADIPTLNQNTTGTAANVTGTVAIANGGTGATTAAGALTALGAYAATNPNGYTSNTGTVTSVGMTVPTGLSVSGTPITSSGTLAISLASGYSIPTTASQTNWDTAYTDRNKWDGGATGLVAATGRTSLGVTATGSDTTYAYRANNLSDLASAATARTNLGLGTAATMAGPSGPIVGTTDTQTLTNKTLTGYTETVYSLTGTDISPANGTIQYKTLSANTTFTETIADGQCVTLMLNPATYTVTWPTTTWIGSVASTAPTLIASVYNCITFFQIAGTLYGKYEGRV